jgi:hypothetical protein
VALGTALRASDILGQRSGWATPQPVTTYSIKINKGSKKGRKEII